MGNYGKFNKIDSEQKNSMSLHCHFILTAF